MAAQLLPLLAPALLPLASWHACAPSQLLAPRSLPPFMRDLQPMSAVAAQASPLRDERAVAIEGTRNRQLPFVASLSFLAGVSDFVCFHNFNCYATMMTGNMLSLASSVAATFWMDASFFVAILLHYVTGVAVFRGLDRTHSRRYSLRKVAATVMALFTACEILLFKTHSRWPMLLIAFGYGLINAVSSETTGVITTMATGHLQKIANALADNRGLKASSNSFVVIGSLMSGIAVASTSVRLFPFLKRLPCFVVLGATYALLLWSEGRMQPPSPDASSEHDSCELDTYETKCV